MMTKTDPALLAYLEQKVKAKEQETMRMAKLHGKAASLGLSIMPQGLGRTKVMRYYLLDKDAGEPWTDPNGEAVSLTLDDLEQVLERKPASS
jgi:hypothetical protein